VNSSVSRETVGRQVFGDRFQLAVRYEEILRTDGVLRGLVGPREAGRMWERHLFNCAAIGPAIDPGATVADVGSGAGLPGIVLAISRPDLEICLVEPLLRRATFLTEVVDRLDLSGVEIRRDRADALHGKLLVDVVTARAVAPLERLAAWCLPLLRPGGLLLALKGERAVDELVAAEPALPGLGGASWGVDLMGHGMVDPLVRVVRVRRADTDWRGGRAAP